MPKPSTSADPQFFATPADLRRWLSKHHATASEAWIGFYKVDSGRPSITWPQSVDEALCFGWIDGRRMSIDAVSYKIRFTPRRARSIWSEVNIKRVAALTEMGRMTIEGLQAPSYQKAANWWVMGAKREETRVRRLQRLIADSEAGRWIAQFIAPAGKK